MKNHPNDIRRNAAGIPQPTQEQLAAAHAYAADLMRGEGASVRAVPPLFLACALWNVYLHNRRLQEELTKIAAVVGCAVASGVLTLQGIADDDNDNEPAAADPRMN